MSKLYISSGDTPTSQTDLYISQAKSHFIGTTTTSSSRVTSHTNVTSQQYILPDPVCVVDERYIRPLSTVYVEQPKKRPSSSNSSRCATDRLQSNVDDVESDSTFDQVQESSVGESRNTDDKENESTFNSDDDYETESDIVVFCRHRRPQPATGQVLSTLRGVQSLIKFLGGSGSGNGNAGEKYWNLWLDIERAKVAHNNEELQTYVHFKL